MFRKILERLGLVRRRPLPFARPRQFAKAEHPVTGEPMPRFDLFRPGLAALDPYEQPRIERNAQGVWSIQDAGSLDAQGDFRVCGPDGRLEAIFMPVEIRSFHRSAS